MIIATDATTKTLTHRCERCQEEYALAYHDLMIADAAIATPPCPICLTRGIQTTEHFRRNVTPYEAGEAQHPESLVGQFQPESGGIIMEDTRWHGPPHHMAQCQHIRALHRHLGLPLHEDR